MSARCNTHLVLCALLLGLMVASTIFFWQSASVVPSVSLSYLHRPALPGADKVVVIVAVHGLAEGWHAGEPLMSLSLRHHIVAPLVRGRATVHVLFCLDSPLLEGDLRAVLLGGAASTRQFVYASTKWKRKTDCFSRALRDFGEPTWWVALRSDFILYDDLPELHTLSHAAIHARARLVRWDTAALTTAHFSYGTECVEMCSSPCPLFLKPFVVADDQFAILPHSMAGAYFSEVDHNVATSESMGCKGIFHPDLTQVWPKDLHYAKKRENFLGMPEIVFTCSVVAQGCVFEPLALRARLNPYVRDPNNWFGVNSVSWTGGNSSFMSWPVSEERNCSA